MADVLWAFSLAKAVKGHPFYLSDESEEKTYSAQMKQDGGFSDVRLFAEQGGESVAQNFGRKRLSGICRRKYIGV